MRDNIVKLGGRKLKVASIDLESVVLEATSSSRDH